MFYLLTDHLSTARDVVNSSGTVVASYEFAEYGQRIATSESGVSSQKTFVGGLSVQDEVADTGLMLMGHRFYDPSGPAGGTGRFLNRDPIGFRGGLNLFEYARSSPIQQVDPRGLEPPARVMDRRIGIDHPDSAYPEITGDMLLETVSGTLAFAGLAAIGLESAAALALWYGIRTGSVAALEFGTAYFFGGGLAVGGGLGVASQRSPAGSPRFDPVKLSRIQNSMASQGVCVRVGGRFGESLLRSRNADGVTFPRAGDYNATVYLPENPSRLAVVEELLHVGQARRLGWPTDLTPYKLEMEIGAQQRLLHIAERQGWTQGEIDSIRSYLQLWESMQ
jgi:RHS repeat-associated protein